MGKAAPVHVVEVVSVAAVAAVAAFVQFFQAQARRSASASDSKRFLLSFRVFQNYKNFQAAAKNLCTLAGIPDIRWPAPPLSPTDVENLAKEFPDSNIRGTTK